MTGMGDGTQTPKGDTWPAGNGPRGMGPPGHRVPVDDLRGPGDLGPCYIYSPDGRGRQMDIDTTPGPRVFPVGKHPGQFKRVQWSHTECDRRPRVNRYVIITLPELMALIITGLVIVAALAVATFM